jgi:cysteine synthase A
MLEPVRYLKEQGCSARLLLKLECFNPLGSVKDRLALGLIEDAEQQGLLKPGGVIIEPTGGSAGISLAFVGRIHGYRVIITMPDIPGGERRSLLKALGAEVVLTPASRGMQGAIRKAEELAATIPGAYIPRQFDNQANPQIHRRTTAQEILRDTEGHVDVFVAGVGTGGTLTGIAEVLKEHNPAIKVVAVEPADSPVLSGGKSGAHKLQGIGAGFTPPVLNQEIYDEVMAVRNDEAFEACRVMAHTEALLLGVSAGAALHAATQLARRAEYRGKTIVSVMPDTGERYLSSNLFD